MAESCLLIGAHGEDHESHVRYDAVCVCARTRPSPTWKHLTFTRKAKIDAYFLLT